LGDSLVEYALAWEAEVAALTQEREVIIARAEKAEATVNDLTEKLLVAEDKLARPLWHTPSDDMPELPTVFEIAPHGSTLKFKFVFLEDDEEIAHGYLVEMQNARPVFAK
jgi:hypothetical protein